MTAKCSYCQKNIERGTGKLLILRTGRMLYFCSGKCEAYSQKLGRNPVKLKWTRPEKPKQKT
jgi:large subunit ribosomal protein L24e